ncbi:MAG: DUF6455 family protein [Reyranellaceae bacterium]
MTTLQDLRQTLSRFVDERRKRRQLRHELAQLGAMGDLDAVLADIGLNRSQIEPLIEGCGSRELLDRMLARLDIDPARLPVEELRDMTWACTACPDKRKCREALAEADEPDFHSFCPNADHLDHALGAAAPARAANDGDYRPTADDFRRLRAETSQRETRAMLYGVHLLA